SKARDRHGEAPARAMFAADAARTDIPAGQDGTAFGLEITQIDGTTLEMFRDPALAEAFGVPSAARKPLRGLVGLPTPAPRRRKIAGDKALPSLPDTIARLVSFTVLTRTRSGRTKTARIRLLTTLLDPGLYPAGELAVLYQKRWLAGIAFLHLKKTVRGARR